MNEKEFFIYLGSDNADRLRFSMRKDKGVIVDLLIQYESFINDLWHTIVRYDCAHGFFHRDMMKPNGEKEKKIIDMPNLNTAFTYAKQDIEDRWIWYKEQYIR